MADETKTGGENGKPAEGNGAAAQPQQQPRLQILNQYTRDLSFENIAAQKGGGGEGKPDVKVQVNLDVQRRGEDRYEVAIKLKVDSRVGETPAFLMELDYAGLFLIQNVAPEQLHALLMMECPRLIFPFVRRIVSDVIHDGGYPALNLEIIDFVALYRAEIARRQAEAGSGDAPAQA